MQSNKPDTNVVTPANAEELHSKAFGMDSLWVPVVVGGQAIAAFYLAEQIHDKTVGTQAAIIAIVVLSMVFPMGRDIHEFFLRRRHRKAKRAAEAASA
jgi:hypothetical protein